VEHRHEEREQSRTLLCVVRLPHADFETGEAIRIEMPHRPRPARRRDRERDPEREDDDDRKNSQFFHGSSFVDRLRLLSGSRVRDDTRSMSKAKHVGPPEGRELISLAQKLARDAERHAILSASLASQADRLMIAGLRQLDLKQAESKPRPRAVA
jgi:hypothetical protein